jgi:nucleoside transporter
VIDAARAPQPLRAPPAPPTSGRPATTMNQTDFGVRARLSGLMFLQYAIWGAWLPILWPYLADVRGFKADEIGTMFMVGAVGALLAPFIAGQVADRFLATQKFVGLLHLVGALLMWQLASIETYWGFLWFSLCYSILYCPTMPLTNAIAFHHLADRDKEFGQVRLWGTIGWIAVGIAVGQWLLHHHTPAGATEEAIAQAQALGRADAFKLSSVLGLAMGLYSFTLPDTPPRKDAGRSAIGAAFAEVLSNRALRVLFLVSIPISCIHQFYFVHTSGFLSTFQTKAADSINAVFGVGGGGLMTIGQMSEIVVMASMPILARLLSKKHILVLGCAAYAARMAVFAYIDHVPEAAQLPVAIVGVALHGLVFCCFIFVAFMIVDEETGADVRASAQSLYNLVIVGIGVIAGSWISSKVALIAQGASETLVYKDRAQTAVLFGVPMWASLACLVLIALFYPSVSSKRPQAT